MQNSLSTDFGVVRGSISLVKVALKPEDACEMEVLLVAWGELLPF